MFERNGIGCDLPDGEVCCGMPWLDAGDVEKFEEHAPKNVKVLAAAVKAGQDVVVPQPTCAYVLKNEYPDFLGTDDARLVAEHTFDTSEYLMARHKEEPLDTDFRRRRDLRDDHLAGGVSLPGAADRPEEPRSHGAHRGQGDDGRALLGHRRHLGTAGRERRDGAKIAKPLMEAVTKSDADLIAGDCHLSNTAIKEGTGKTPVHPLQVLARAYGIEERDA